MTILAQLFWLAVSLLESDYEHEFLLALRLLARVLHRLPLDRPDARDKVEKLQQQLKWAGYPGVHALLLKVTTNECFCAVGSACSRSVNSTFSNRIRAVRMRQRTNKPFRCSRNWHRCLVCRCAIQRKAAPSR